jgi:hypothetical protein
MEIRLAGSAGLNGMHACTAAALIPLLQA